MKAEKILNDNELKAISFLKHKLSEAQTDKEMDIHRAQIRDIVGNAINRNLLKHYEEEQEVQEEQKQA